MGSVSLKIGDGTARFKKVSYCSSALNLLMLFSVVTTNLFALYAFTSSPKSPHHHLLLPHTHKNISLISEQVALILREIDSSQKKLAQMEKELLGYESFDLSSPKVPNEVRNFLQPHLLPLGKDSRTGITEMVASIGHSCVKSMDFLSQFMSYKVNGLCPDDWSLGQKLILSGCEPLPRRRCFAKTIPKVGLLSFPDSLWGNYSETIYSWSGLGCKNLACLNVKKLNRDCAGCFDIGSSGGYERQRYVKGRGKNDFLIDDVLGMSGNGGGIRIGFDIGGGSGTFAARMAERNVTIVTATLNVDAPFNEFIAARGLFPLYLSVDHRFPFHDNVFDLVHVGNVLDVGGRPEKLEFLMFDIDRVLRAGGLFWLDNFLCSSEDKKTALTRLIERFGYKKLKWVVGEKINGSGKSEVYLSAVLQKPEVGFGFVTGKDGPQTSVLHFGTMVAVDDPVTEGPDLKSNSIGRAQGMYINSQLDGKGLHLMFSVIFTDGKYKGSTLEIQGADLFAMKEREFSVVSGTGYFRFVRGYGIMTTQFIDIPNLRAVLKLDVTVNHY